MMKQSIFLLALLAIQSQASLPGPASAVFDKGALFTVSGYTGSSTLSGFPALVRISENSPSGFSYDDLHSQADGADIAFVGMDGAGLPFEIDTWNASGESLIWVRLPTMTNGTQFVMCWGGGTSGKTVCNESPFSGYVGVWHMSEASGTVADSSGNGLAATPSGTAAATMSDAVAGKVGNGRQCANEAYLSIANASALDVGNAFAVSGWFDMSSGQPSGDVRFFSRKVRGQSADNGWEVIRKSGNIAARGATGDNIASYTPSPSFAGAGWKHVFVVYDDRTATIYEDGVQKASATAGAAPTDNDNSFSIGSYSGGASSYFVGSVDECRLLVAVPTADWAKAEYDSMADAAFLTAGTAEYYGDDMPPSVGIVVTDRQYTNASFTVSVGSIGTGAGSADVSVAFAATADFASPLWTTNYTVSGPDALPFSRIGLATGTTYYVQATIVNDQNTTNTSPVVSLATLSPGAPAGAATFVDRGFMTMEATGVATAFGSGAASATMRLEASTDADFATVVAGPETNATPGTAAALAISGLAPDTSYHLRLRIRNDWGLDTFVALPDAATRAVPFAVTGIGWTFSPDGSAVDVTFGVSGIYDGATGSATLYYGDRQDPAASPGTRNFAAAATLAWTDNPFTADPMYAKVVLSATLAGQTYTQTFAAPISAGSASVAVSDIAEHASAETAVRVRPGDVVTLPELSGNERYILGNALFGSLDGNVLTALRPGILGIHCVDNDANTNTLAVLVLPETPLNGAIYVYKEKSVSNHSCIWTEPHRWEKIGSDANDSCPNGTGDIAIIPYYDETGVQFDLREEIVLAALYVGVYRDAAASISLRSLSSPTHGIAFERTDGEPARIQLCPNAPATGNNEYRVKLTIADSIPKSAFRSDTIISGGSDRADSSYPQGRFAFDAQLFDIAAGATVSLFEMDTWETGAALATMGGGRLTGAGTFWNRSAAAIRFGRNKTSFTGLLRDSGGYGHQQADRCGPTEIRSNSTNCTAETVGWVGVNASGQPISNWKYGVGCVVVGHNHGHNAPPAHPGTNWFPRVATLHGGLLQILPHPVVWGEPGVLDRKYAQRLVAADGFSYVRGSSQNTSGGYPVNWFEADELGHENKATLRIDDDSRRSTASTAAITNQATFLHGWASAAIGPAGNPEASDAYPTIPWIVSPLDGGNDKIYFAAFDAADRLVRPAMAANSTPLSDFSAGRNAFCRNAGIALAEDLTVNSLYLQNDTKGKTLGAGRTLTVTSGGLILSDVNDDKNPGAAAIGEEGGSSNGALVLGDEAHPAYVWAYGASTSSAYTAPNQIWAPVTAPGGFVVAYTGHLVLGGDQTGIADELVVNAGTLQLGTADQACQLAKDLPIRIFANATLSLPNAGSTSGTILRFDGAAGWFGKVAVSGGVSAKCRRMYLRDYPESPEWVSMPRGVYGSSESGAEFARDDLFSGSGTLTVFSDDCVDPSLLILR